MRDVLEGGIGGRGKVGLGGGVVEGEGGGGFFFFILNICFVF